MPKRRTPLAPVVLDAYEGGRSTLLRRLTETSVFKINDSSGLYGVDTLAEFLQYEIDGSFQTDINEYMVQPFCLVSLYLDGITRLRDEDTDHARRVLQSVGTAFSKLTRRADRAARFGADFSTLLRRTTPKSVRESYVPRVSGPLAEAAREAGMPTTLSVGIAGHPDAAVRNVEDVFFKSIYALEEARKLGPGHVVAYDLKIMPATVSDESKERLMQQH
jgi:GGDEF domain-containing protein